MLFNKKHPQLLVITIWAIISLVVSWVGSDLTHRYDKQKHVYTLEVDLESSVPGKCELFWRSGESGFTANQSTDFKIRNSRERDDVDFTLPQEPISQLRLDPLDRVGQVKIYGLKLVNGLNVELPDATQNWNLIPVQGIGTVQQAEDAILVECISNDPILLIDLDYQTLSTVLSASDASEIANRRWQGVIIFAVTMFLFSVLGHWFFPILVASFVWIIAFPGIYTPDSITQIEQAISGVYYNWHPAIIPIILRGFFALGIPVSGVIWIQCTLGMLAVHWLMVEILMLCDPDRHYLAKAHFGSLFSSIGLFLFLISPLCPFSSYIVTLWKDVWFSVAALLISASTLAWFRWKKTKGKGTAFSYFYATGLFLMMLFAINLRHNAIVLIPSFVGILWLVIRESGLWKKLNFVLAVSILFMNTQHWIDHAFDVKETYPKYSVMSLELVGLLVLHPELRAEFPYVSSQLHDDYQEQFVWAGFRYLKWNKNPFVSEDLVKGSYNPELSSAYFRAVKRHPILMTQVKLINFLQLMNPLKSTEWLTFRISSNDLGLRRNLYARHYYMPYTQWSWQVYRHPLLRWISAVHLLWIGIGMLFSIGFIVKKRRILAQHLAHLLLISIPFLYVASYLLATPWSAFRYLYPSTILIQVFVISLLLRSLALSFEKLWTRRENPKQMQ